MKNLNILWKAPSKKTSSPASSFKIFLQSLNVSIDPACICDTDDDKLLKFRKASEKNEARRCLLKLALHCTVVSPPHYCC